MVEATINYLRDMPERPYYYLYEPPAGEPWRNVRADARTVAIHDGRELPSAGRLDVEGVTLVPHETAVGDLFDQRAIRAVYYPEMEKLVAEVTGARRVLAFDHNLRSGPRAERAQDLSEKPVRFAHNDYTEKSGPQRVRDLLPADAEDLLQRRFAVINVWRPIQRPVFDTPLAVCDARSIGDGDLVQTDLRYRDRTGEVYSLRYGAEHRWLYFPRMQPNEAMLIKCYDSERDRARFTAHSAFDDPNAPADAPPRESIEVRTLAFF
jgi:hypothetical protein